MDSSQLLKFAELLAALGSQDNEIRRQAEAQYNATRTGDPNLFVFALVSVVSGEFPPHIKQQGGVLLRQVMRCTRDDFLWTKISPEAQIFVKTTLLRLLETERATNSMHAICNVVGELGSYLGISDWPELFPKLFALVTSADAIHKESGLRVLVEVIGSAAGNLLKGENKDAVVSVMSSCLQPSNPANVRVQAVLLFCRIAMDLPSSQWKVVQSQAPAVLAAARSLVQEGNESAAQECLEGINDVAETEPLMWKLCIPDLVNTGLSIALGKDLEATTRGIALEAVCSFVEAKGKLCVKSHSAAVRDCIRCCMQLMLELEDDDTAAWSVRFADDADEQEEEEVYSVGLHNLDRFSKVFGAELVLPIVFQTVGEFLSQPRWQGRVAAVMALSQIAEIIEEDAHSDEIVRLLLAQLAEPNQHPRVKYAAIHSLGQVATDCSPHVEEAWHAEVIPALCRAMDDQVLRVGSHACSAFVNFGEETDLDNLLPHADTLMQKLFPRMQKGQPRQVRQEAVTAVAVVAAKIESSFGKYYSLVMPVLKQMVGECTSQEERILRGKAFECLSLLGTAVGKEAFRADARDAMAAVMHLQQNNQLDDKEGTFKEFVHESCQRIAGVLKDEFAQFLPGILPALLNAVTTAATFKHIDDLENAEASGESDEELQVLEAEDGYRGIKTSQVQELLSALETVTAFVQSTGASYRPYVQQTAVTLLPLLDFEFDEDARAAALDAWAEMVGLSDAAVARELLTTAITKLSKAMDDEEYDMWALEAQTRGLSECLKRAPTADLLSPAEVHAIVNLAVKLMQESLQRRAQASEAQEEDEDDEDEKADAENEEAQNESVRVAICELLGSMMEKHKSAFLQANGAQTASSLMHSFLTQDSKTEDKSLGLYIACDVLEFLGSSSVPYWSVFMDALLNAVNDSDAQLRQAACFGVNVASRIPEFSNFAANAAQRLAAVLRTQKSKKHALATDNAAAALGWIIEKQTAALGAGINDAVSLWLDHLPLTEDEEEGKTTHAQLLRLVAQGQLIQGANSVKALKVFAGCWKKDNCDENTADGIVALFRQLGKDVVAREAAKFSQKEKSQIARIFEKAGI